MARRTSTNLVRQSTAISNFFFFWRRAAPQHQAPKRTFPRRLPFAPGGLCAGPRVPGFELACLPRGSIGSDNSSRLLQKDNLNVDEVWRSGGQVDRHSQKRGLRGLIDRADSRRKMVGQGWAGSQ
jgi:hypothetical protein